MGRHGSAAAADDTTAPGDTAAPSGAHPGAADRVRVVRADEVRLDLPSYRTGAARWARDRYVPLGIEVGALEAVEKAAGWV